MNTAQTATPKTWWKSRELDALHHVDHPAAYYVTNAASVAFAALLLWNAYFTQDHFWANLNMIFTAGALTLGTAAGSLLQIRLLRGSIGLPLIGLLFLAVSAWLYQDANNQIVLLLHRYFSFDVSQLAQAVLTGTKTFYAIEVAAGTATFGFVAATSVAYFCAFRRSSGGKSYTDWWFGCTSLGMTLAFLVVVMVSFRIFNTTAADAIAVHAAYDLDFSEQYDCPLAPRGTKVLFSKTSDNVGYAMRMTLPDRPLLSIHKKDADVVSLRSSHVTVVSCNQPPTY